MALKYMKKYFILFLISQVVICSTALAFEPKFKTISIVELISNAEKYHNKKIRIKGYFHCQFEDVAIYLSRDDAAYGIRENAIWIRVTSDINQFCSRSNSDEKSFTNHNKQLNMKMVEIEGIYSSSDHGHMGLYHGAINEVETVRELIKKY